MRYRYAHLALWLVATIVTSTTVMAEDVANQLSTTESLSGWKLLFDGTSTSGWRNYNKKEISSGWKVTDGALVRSENGAGDIITNAKYQSFELSLEYKISKGGNSGVMFHVAEGSGPPWHTGPEVQIQDNEDGTDPQKSGWLYQLFKPIQPGNSSNKTTIDATRPAGQWNQLFLRVSPRGCEVSMNGVLYFRFKMGDENWKKLVSESKFAKLEQFGNLGQGHICLQDHGNLVAYRNIKIRELPEDGVVSQPIHGKLALQGELAFPKLKWSQWEPIDEGGKVQKLRIIELTYAKQMPGRLYAASQSGQIYAFDHGRDVESSSLFLDLGNIVSQWTGPGANEQGLLGLAMHPDFKTNGSFFVCYTRQKDDRTIVSRFKVMSNDSSKADPASEEIILEVAQPFKNHNGGSIEFGPDGYLYIALGDGGLRNDPNGNGQNLTTLLGSILRIDIDKPSSGKPYGIPSDNPFVQVDQAKPEIYAYGMRNPWRIAFDKANGNLWMGDVGQELWEEVDIVRKGGNYGWSQREGNHLFGNRKHPKTPSEPIDPIWEYDHSVGKSITGGRVYRGKRLPELVGKYIYADYVSGSVWALSYDESTGKATRNEQVIANGVPILAFAEDSDGEVFYMIESTKGDCIYKFVNSK